MSTIGPPGGGPLDGRSGPEVVDAAADAAAQRGRRGLPAGAGRVLDVTNEGDSTGTLTFSRFGETEDISAPEDAIDLTEVMGGA